MVSSLYQSIYQLNKLPPTGRRERKQIAHFTYIAWLGVGKCEIGHFLEDISFRAVRAATRIPGLDLCARVACGCALFIERGQH